MAEDEATEEISIDDDVPVDDVLADAQDTLADLEGVEDGDPGGTDGGASPDSSTDGGLEADLGTGTGRESGDVGTPTGSDDGSLLPSMPEDLFSAKHFLGGGLVAGLGALVGSGVLTPIPIVGTIVGLALGGVAGTAIAGFLLGAVSSRSSYLEVGLLSAIVGGAAAGPVSAALVPVFGLGLGVFAVGAVVAVLVGLLGHYLGRDLRSGVTRSVDGDEPF